LAFLGPVDIPGFDPSERTPNPRRIEVPCMAAVFPYQDGKG